MEGVDEVFPKPLSPDIMGEMDCADGITDVVYRGYLGYIPGFQVYLDCVGCTTELLLVLRHHTWRSVFLLGKKSRLFSICVG